MNEHKYQTMDFKEIDNLSKDEAGREVRELREEIDYHDYLYYVKNQPEISDALYDRLFQRLEDLEKAFPDLQSDVSPTRRVGAEPVDELKRIEHAAEMLSLNAAHRFEEVKEFHEFILRNSGEDSAHYILEPKFDGLSVEAVYEKGRFQWGATRGNGSIGEDISENIKTVNSLPLHLRDRENAPEFLAVRGEIFISKKNFQQLNERRIREGKTPFANPRNAAAGAVRQLNPAKVAETPLDIYVYELLKIDGMKIETHHDAIKLFTKWGFKTNPYFQQASSVQEIRNFWEDLEEKRDNLEYEIDGVVVKIDSFRVRDELGSRRRSPRWALAWKFEPQQETTILEKIVVQVGRSGILTPVALLRPVDVGGVTVSRATLHNADEVAGKDVRDGDRVRISRAGDVIPEVVERIETTNKDRSEPFTMPKRCPSCGARIYREGAFYLCPAGLSCPPQLIGRITHYASRDALDIQGLGEKTAESLVRRELVKNIADLYTLSTDDILSLEGFAQKSAEQLHQAIQDKKSPVLDRFLYGLGVRHIGLKTAQILARRFRSLKKLKAASLSALEEIPDVGHEIALSVTQFFEREQNRAVLQKLEQAGVTVRNMSAADQKTPLEGKTFVFTGRLEHYTRKDAERRVEELGGRAASSVSGSTDYVVAGEKPGTKLKQAEKQKITILNEEQFDQLL